MSEGRTSRLYRALVRDKKIASFSAGFSGLPGMKYPHLFAFYAFPLPGHTTQEVADAIHVEIERLKKEDISDDELKMIKTRTKANLIRSLGDNEGLATQLATYQTRYGDWRELFRSVDRIDKVTKADIRRVANETFNDTNRTVGVIETTKVAGHGERSELRRIRSENQARRIREVRNETDHSNECAAFSCLAIVMAAMTLMSTQQSAAAGSGLAANPDPNSAGFSSPATQAHSTFQRYGDLPAGRSRTAADQRHRPHSRRLEQRACRQSWTRGSLWRSLAHRRHQDANRRSTRRLSGSTCRESRNRRRSRFNQHQPVLL